MDWVDELLKSVACRRPNNMSAQEILVQYNEVLDLLEEIVEPMWIIATTPDNFFCFYCNSDSEEHDPHCSLLSFRRIIQRLVSEIIDKYCDD